MTQLTTRAREDFEAAGIDVTDLAESIWGHREWRGDECGCTDDRCIGHHHTGSHCECRAVVIQQHRDELVAGAQAAGIWARHLAASEADRAAVHRELAGWVKAFHPISTSWSLDVVVDGRHGITVTSPYNDLIHLVWEAPTG